MRNVIVLNNCFTKIQHLASWQPIVGALTARALKEQTMKCQNENSQVIKFVYSEYKHYVML